SRLPGQLLTIDIDGDMFDVRRRPALSIRYTRPSYLAARLHDRQRLPMKYVVALSMLCGLLLSASSASAGPISGCTQDGVTGQLTCDLYLTDAIGNPSTVGVVSPGFDAGWLVGYSFLLNSADPTQKSHVDDVLVIHSDHLDLYSQAAGALF